MSREIHSRLLVPLDGSMPAEGHLEIAQIIAGWT